MHKIKNRSVMLGGLAAIAIGLTACATPTPFMPADPGGGNGYTVTQVEKNRYRLTFAGNDITPRQQVDINLLYLASQVTLRNGGDWFELGKNSTDKTTSYPSYPGPIGPYGGLGWGGYHGAWYGGYETDFNSPQNSWLEAADILVHQGTKPAGDPAAYDAHDVAAHLVPAIHRDGHPGLY